MLDAPFLYTGKNVGLLFGTILVVVVFVEFVACSFFRYPVSAYRNSVFLSHLLLLSLFCLPLWVIVGPFANFPKSMESYFFLCCSNSVASFVLCFILFFVILFCQISIVRTRSVHLKIKILAANRSMIAAFQVFSVNSLRDNRRVVPSRFLLLSEYIGTQQHNIIRRPNKYVYFCRFTYF